jgi:hypothetical protein
VPIYSFSAPAFAAVALAAKQVVHQPEDVPKVLGLFRMSYERAKDSAERRRERSKLRYSNGEQGQRSA